MNRPRFRHHLFSRPDLHEDDIAVGMPGFRWLRDDGRRTHALATELVSPSKPYVVCRPVTIVALDYHMLTPVTYGRRAREDEMTLEVVADNEPIRWLLNIDVRDEETHETLRFGGDPPQKRNGILQPPNYRLYVDARNWRLKLGEYKDDRFHDVQDEDEAA